MPQQSYKFVVVGAGLAGVSAVEAIRERDESGGIMLFGSERHLPYHRPPLSKKLWSGEKKISDIFVHDMEFFDNNDIDLALGTSIVGLDLSGKTVSDSAGNVFSFEKLLIATGGLARRLVIPGGDLDGVIYFRDLDGYYKARNEAKEGKSAVVIGGGFIGSEMAASLALIKLEVTWIFRGEYPLKRVFPADLARAIQDEYRNRGVRILNDEPKSIERSGGKLVTTTGSGLRVESDLVIVGIGIEPSVKLVRDAGLGIDDGLLVDERLRTTHPDVYAAGDIARFPYTALGKTMRVEHWDNALNQGKLAGANMAGADEPYTYMPYFFSDLFDFGYEAVGDIDAGLQTFEDWQDEYKKGVIYYLENEKVRGAMLCNVWDKVDAARELIRSGRQATTDDLRGAIR
jgi:NADPH-dependent 2,4-dienoyl-CoA reductase/sulfur reductase-like enzyme